MAPYQVGFALFIITLALSRIQLSSCHVLKGSVTCLDCNQHADLSGIKVSVKCSKVKTLVMATTEYDGSFETNLPFDTPTLNNCYAKILGGPNQLFVSRKEADPTIIKAQEDDNSYSISKSLRFYMRCPLSNKDNGECEATMNSKTVDLPLPKEWGLAPTSYYLPFFPIIGIP